MKAMLTAVLLAAALPASAAEIAVYKGAGCTGRGKVAGFEAYLGRRTDRVVDFVSFNSWADMEGSARWIAGCWKPTGRRLMLSIPMLPHRDASLAEGAAGAYDAHFAEIGRTLVEAGQADAVLRIGWEFNGGWYPWAAAHDPAGWVGLWRHIALTLRAVPGNRFTLVWNPVVGQEQIPPEKVWPGDDVVDLIGVDVYNQTWNKKAVDGPSRWTDLTGRAFGLDWVKTFAAAHRKPLAVPEWGTGTRPDGHGGGDDAYFVDHMAAWIKAAPVRIHAYWDYKAPDYDAAVSDGRQPRAAAALRRDFGPGAAQGADP